MKIDKRKKYILMLDTETCNGIMVNGKLDLTQSLVYDLGVAVIDKKGKVYETGSYVIAETFIDMAEVMKSAYYAEKIPQYWNDIRNGRRSLVTLFKANQAVKALIKKYNIKTVAAHNAGFDLRALNNTQRYITKSKYRYFMPYGIEWWDTLKMAQDIFTKKKMYRVYCEENGYMTKHKTPRVRLTAEILHRYLTGNNDFDESHTGLEDVMIEKDILAYLLRQHKKMRKTLF